MATVRSISPTKSDRLLTRRLTRASSSSTPLSHRKITISKTTPITVTTVKRRKPSRMSSKKSPLTAIPVPIRLNSFTNINSTTDHNDLTNKMASTTISELPPIRRTSRISDSTSITTNMHLPQINSDTVLDHKQAEEPQDDIHISNQMNETLSTSSSRKSSRENIEFTVEALDTIRTVGTGKRFEFCNSRVSLFFSSSSQERLVEYNSFVIVIQTHFMPLKPCL